MTTTRLHIPLVALQVNEEIAVNHMRRLCTAYANRDATGVRVHARLLHRYADETGDKTIRFAAGEADSVLKLMGVG